MLYGSNKRGGREGNTHTHTDIVYLYRVFNCAFSIPTVIKFFYRLIVHHTSYNPSLPNPLSQVSHMTQARLLHPSIQTQILIN